MTNASSMRFLEKGKIDKKLWDRCIQNSSMATIFAEYDFLTIACPDWHALVMGNYEYVMPLPTKAKLGIKYIYTPPFFSRLGIFSDQEITSQITTEFFNHIPLLYRQIDLLLAPNNPAEQSGLNPIAMRSYRLNLHRPYILTEQLFSENTRRNIKSANKVDLTYTQDLTIHEVVCLFKNGRGREKSVRYAKKDYLLLCKLAGYVAERGMLDVVGARDESGRLLAGALFLRDRHAIWFWFSGRDVRFPEKKAMFFVISEYLKTQEKQDNYLDFNGSMNENIARFYKGFGGESYDFPFVNLRRYSYLSPFIKLYKTIIKHDKI